MKVLVPSTRFNKDLILVRRRGYHLARLQGILEKLQTDEPLPALKRAHPLEGAPPSAVPARTAASPGGGKLVR